MNPGKDHTTMGMKTRGGMYCINEGKPVAAVKTTTRIRNTFAVGASIATMGGSLLAAKVNGWHCPNCGGPVADKIPPTPSSGNSSGTPSLAVLDEIERLDGLRQRGVLSAAEFQSYKTRLLNGGSATTMASVQRQQPQTPPAPAPRQLPPPTPARAELPAPPPPAAPVTNSKGLPIPHVPERKPSTGFWAQFARSFKEGWNSSNQRG